MRVVTKSNLFTRNYTYLKSQQVQSSALVDVGGFPWNFPSCNKLLPEDYFNNNNFVYFIEKYSFVDI